ncbi:hypothetical protein DFA_02051 [Cavenderia fasciculata]|uniref:Uncharacterized protein n=1 Tax=Cavenderia fasciculata TaxID=261658 RepID=F4PYJ9_CACFS|nr:uncharacterized protein DFA_02051 [Cavenderia fasciculata]EGG19265.1 hypothetical protein DFA_02051 [Cavenderia fasciculata]|eukprot:XP_004357536.1 hypothetical protein DFA_02051 [Cavenderia fasciculata]
MKKKIMMMMIVRVRLVAGADGSASKDLLVNARFIKTLKPLLATSNPVHTEGAEKAQGYPVQTEGAQGARDNLDGRVGDDRTLYQDLNKIQSTLQGQGEESIGKGKSKLQDKDNNGIIEKINYDDTKINFKELLHQYRQQLSSPTTTKYFNMKEMNSIRIIQSLQQNNNDSPTKDIINSIGVITSRAWLKPLFIVKSKRTFKYQGNGRSRTEYPININDCEVWIPNDLVNQHVRAVSKTQQVSLAIVSTEKKEGRWKVSSETRQLRCREETCVTGYQDEQNVQPYIFALHPYRSIYLYFKPGNSPPKLKFILPPQIK